MKHPFVHTTRRAFLGTAALGAAAFTAPGAFAEELIRTPRQTEGPFYPDKLPLDTDNDLIIINDAITPAVGEVTHLSGRILDAKGNPVRNALVEIWQVRQQRGLPPHRGPQPRASTTTNFQGFGRFLTGSSGEYYFRTIKPVPYPGRDPPHPLQDRQGAARSCSRPSATSRASRATSSDGIYRGIRDPKARDSVTVDFTPIKARASASSPPGSTSCSASRPEA